MQHFVSVYMKLSTIIKDRFVKEAYKHKAIHIVQELIVFQTEIFLLVVEEGEGLYKYLLTTVYNFYPFDMFKKNLCTQ